MLGHVSPIWKIRWWKVPEEGPGLKRARGLALLSQWPMSGGLKGVRERATWDLTGEDSGTSSGLSHPCMTTGKTTALTRWTFVGKVMSLLFNMLSRLVIAFLPRSKHLLISWLQSLLTVILEPPKIVWHCFHCFPIYFPWSDGTGCHDLCFLNVEL